jgi:hypothetical protein
MKSCLIILNCIKYAHKRELQRATWLHHVNIPWFHIIGNPEMSNDFEINKNECVIYVKCKDTYESLSMKTYLALYAIRTVFPDIDYILKTDDDMKCNIKEFNNMLQSIDGYDYGGELIYAPRHLSVYHYPNVSSDLHRPFEILETYYCPGRFYFLSKKACDNVLSSKKWVFSCMFEDYAIGYLSTRLSDVKIKTLNAKSIFYEH